MKRLGTIVAMALLLGGSGASAHTAWLVRDANPGVWLLQFGGHQGKLEPAVPAKLKAVSGSNVHLAVAGQHVVIGLHYDNGIHTRPPRPGPTIERPMNEVPGATSATSAVKYGKTIVQWGGVATRPLNQRFEIIPQATAAPAAGQPMRVQVRLDGRPVAGVKIGRGENLSLIHI